MFVIELEDLLKDIELLMQKYTDQHDREVISNYVFLENLALMKNELFGIGSFLEEVKHLDPTGYATVHELIDSLKKMLTTRCQEKGFASAVIVLSERKMAKVLSYIEGHDLQGNCC